MGFVRSVSLLFLSLVYVSATAATLISLSLLVLLDPELYVQALDNADAFNIVEEYASESPFPPEETRPLLVHLINNTMLYLSGETETLDATVDVSKYVDEYFTMRAREFRVCNPGETPYIGTQPNCRPSDQTPQQYLENTLRMMNISTASMGTVNLADVYDPENNREKLRDGIKLFRVSIFGMIFLAFTSLAGIFILTIHSQHQLRWVTINVLIVSLLTLAGGFASYYFLQSVLPEIIAGQLPEFEQELTAFSQTILSEVVISFILYSAIAFFIGVILIIADIFYRKRVGM